MDKLQLNEDSSKEIKNVSSDYAGYHLSATATIENGRITNMNGNVHNTSTTTMDFSDIRFDAYRNGEELKVNYHNIATDERDTLTIISALVDAVVAKYEA